MDEVPRPTLSPSIVDRAQAWFAWFGVARLITSAVAVIIVCVGGWWLVRSPLPPTEATLPIATTGAAATSMPHSTVREHPTPAVVHVAGAVVDPGVYELPDGSRVADAIERAGGPAVGADPGALNLAAVVPDGARVVVPLVGEPVDPGQPWLGGDDSGGSGTGGPVDVNRAAVEQLESLPGIGPTTAAAIIDDRERNGPFSSLADLERVPGIGPAKLAAIADLVST